MLLLVGLGNPGAKYAGNRHNVGFIVADAIQRKYRFSPFRAKFDGEIAEGLIGAERVLLLKPMTYMNDSGRSVAQAARFYKLDIDEIVVLHDEIDLAPGRIRMKLGGGIAGHNGLRSIASHLGPDFWRVRIGVGHPGDKALVSGYVLGDFAKIDLDWLVPSIEAIAEAAPYLADRDEKGFGNKLGLLLSPPKPKTKPPEGKGDKPDEKNGDTE
jgi:PTH1 family peptidyl-tRNA hydrolase